MSGILFFINFISWKVSLLFMTEYSFRIFKPLSCFLHLLASFTCIPLETNASRWLTSEVWGLQMGKEMGRALGLRSALREGNKRAILGWGLEWNTLLCFPFQLPWFCVNCRGWNTWFRLWRCQQTALLSYCWKQLICSSK